LELNNDSRQKGIPQTLHRSIGSLAPLLYKKTQSTEFAIVEG